MDRFSETAFSFRKNTLEAEEDRATERGLDVDSLPSCGDCGRHPELLIWTEVEQLWLCSRCLIGFYESALEMLEGPSCRCTPTAADDLSPVGCMDHDPLSTWPEDYRRYVSEAQALRFLLIEHNLWPIPQTQDSAVESRKAAA